VIAGPIPGPWGIDTRGPYVGRVSSLAGVAVCSVVVPYNDDLRGHKVTKATARLISAAPDLLAALEKCRAEMVMLQRQYAADGKGEEWTDRQAYLIGECDRALNKATKESTK